MSTERSPDDSTSPAAEEPTLRQSKSALLEAAQAAIAEQRTRQSTVVPSGRPRRGRRVFHALLGVLLLGGGGVLAARPVWLVGPSMPAEAPAVREASLTMAAVDAVSRIHAFLETRGSLPGTLAEAGVLHGDLVYERLGDAEFRVSARAGDSTVTLRSTDSLGPIVARALRSLGRRS